MADSEQTFEDALTRLEEVAEQLDAGKLPLDERLALYEEGMKLVRECNRQLTEVQGKLEVLIKDGSEVSTEPLEL